MPLKRPIKRDTAVPGIIDLKVLELVEEEGEHLARQSRVLADAIAAHCNRRRGLVITQSDAAGTERELAAMVRQLDLVIEKWTVGSAAVLEAVPKLAESRS